MSPEKKPSRPRTRPSDGVRNFPTNEANGKQGGSRRPERTDPATAAARSAGRGSSSWWERLHKGQSSHRTINCHQGGEQRYLEIEGENRAHWGLKAQPSQEGASRGMEKARWGLGRRGECGRLQRKWEEGSTAPPNTQRRWSSFREGGRESDRHCGKALG